MHLKISLVLALTISLAGISYMENNPAFHGAAPNDDQLAIGLAELGFEVK